MQNISFKEKVFDEGVFQFVLQSIKFLKGNGSDFERERVLLDSFFMNSSLEDATQFLGALNVFSAEKNLDAFLKIINSFWQRREIFQDIVRTTHFLNQKNFKSWLQLFDLLNVYTQEEDKVRSALMATRHAAEFVGDKTQMDQLLHGMKFFEKLDFFEALSLGQLESKKWLIDKVLEVFGKDLGHIFVLAGWVGTLPMLLFDRKDVAMGSIRSFDIDPVAGMVAEKVNAYQVRSEWKFKSVCMDISKMSFPNTTYVVKRHDGSSLEMQSTADVLINTSCEHIRDLKKWWASIPQGTKVVVQNNNAFGVTDHIGCVNDVEQFKVQLPMSRLLYAGQLELDGYSRFMLIGER